MSQPTETGTPTTSPLVLDPKLRLEDLGVFNRDEDRLVWDTTERLIASCMAALGFTYRVEPYPSGGNRDVLTALYPPDDLVRKFGYAWTTRGLPAPPVSPNADNTDPAFNKALSGPNGCAHDVYQKIQRQKYVDTLEIIDAAAADIRQRALSDQRFLSAQEAWSACLKAKGIAMRSLRDRKRVMGSADPSGPQMISVAVADYACQREVKLAEIDQEIQVELNTEWIDAHPGTVEAIRKAKKAVVDACKQLVTAG